MTNNATIRRSMRRSLHYPVVAASFLAAWALVSPAGAQPPAAPGLAIVGFGDYLWLRVDGRVVALEPGSPAFEVPAGARTVVAQGAATFLLGDTLLRADAGDDFTYTSLDGQGRLLVNAGAVEVAAPGRPPVMVEAGRFIALTGPEAGLLAGAPAAPAPRPSPVPPAPQPSPAPPAPKTPAAAPQAASAAAPETPAAAPGGEWDPLKALAAGFDKLSRVTHPELRLVVELHPFFRLSQTYDSNIYLVPADQAGGARVGGGVVGSWLTVNELGTGLKLPLGKRSALNGLYLARATLYSRQPKTNNAFDQEVRGSYDYSGERGAKASLWESYLNTEEQAFSELVARQRHLVSETGGTLGWEQSRALVYGLSARHTLTKYLDPTFAHNLNQYVLSFKGDIGVKLAPKTKVFLAYGREIGHYSAGRLDHWTAHQFGLGLDGPLGGRLRGHAEAGLQLRRYQNAPAGQPSLVSTLVTSVDMRIQASRRTEARLKVFRSVQDSTFATNRYYTATGVSLGVSHAIRKLTLSLDASAETDRYPNTVALASPSGLKTGARHDDVFSGRVGAAYALRPWLSTDAAFEHRQRASSFSDAFDYRDERTSLGLRVSF